MVGRAEMMAWDVRGKGHLVSDVLISDFRPFLEDNDLVLVIKENSLQICEHGKPETGIVNVQWDVICWTIFLSCYLYALQFLDCILTNHSVFCEK